MTKKKNIKCVYCLSNKDLTKDHIPPKSLFAKPRPSNLISVPSCEKCRAKTPNDDEYFKNSLIMRDVVKNHPDVKTLLNSTIRSYKKIGKWKYMLDLLKRTGSIERKSKAGLFLGSRLGVEVDLNRIYNVVNRVIRGLYYYETGDILPTNIEIRSRITEDFDKNTFSILKKGIIDPLLNRSSPQVIGNNAFSYIYHIRKENKYISAWVTEYYGKIDFFSMTAPTNGL